MGPKTKHTDGEPHWFEKHQYGILLGTLLAVYAFHPFVGERPWVAAALQIAVLFMMVTAIAAFRHNPVAFVLSIGLGITVTVLQTIHRFTEIQTQGVAAALFEIVFYGLIILSIASRLLRVKAISMNNVFGVCSIYLLLAIAWSNVYVIIEKLQPGSFNRPELSEALVSIYSQEDTDLLYFSLITMTTVGYGDITPATPAARTLSALEGLIGQLFIGIVLARVVSMEIGERMAARRSKEGG